MRPVLDKLLSRQILACLVALAFVAEAHPQSVSTNGVSSVAASVQTNQTAQVRRLRPAVHGRRQIIAGLNSTILDQIVFDGLPLEVVVSQLQAEFEKRSRSKQPLNFMFLDPVSAPVNLTPPAGAQPGGDSLDPSAAAVVQAAAPTAPAGPLQFDLRLANVQIRAPLRGLTMAQALDAIMKNTDFPIMFSVTDYAIMVLPRLGNQFSNGFRTAPNTFQQGLQGVVGFSPLAVTP